MFIGHYGVGLAAKRATPLSLGLLFLAVQFLDLLWPTLLLLNVEHVTINTDPASPVPLLFTNYPYSHSLVMACVWALVFALVFWLIKRNSFQALVLGLCVLSHWILDLLVHIPDLPLYFGANAPKVGLGLWHFPITEAIIETTLFVTGTILYLKATKPKNRAGVIIFWILILLLAITHLANLFSPAPTSIKAIAWGAQGMWLFVLLGFWVDRNRINVITQNTTLQEKANT